MPNTDALFIETLAKVVLEKYTSNVPALNLKGE
jgi:hypothetical protein